MTAIRQSESTSNPRRPGHFYTVVLATALALLAVSFTALIVVGALRNSAANRVSDAAFAQDRLNYVVYVANKYDPENPRVVAELGKGVNDLQGALLRLEEQHATGAEHSAVPTAFGRLAQWSQRLAEASTTLEKERAGIGVATSSDQLSDAIQQDVISVTESLGRLQTAFMILVPVALLALAGSVYLVLLLYLSIRATLRWNRDVIASLSEGAEEMPTVTIPAEWIFPGARVLVTQSASIGADLTERVREQRSLAERNDKLSRELTNTVDELVASRTEFQRSAQMAAVGKVAGAVSHEINNPVTGVLGYLAFIRKRSTNEEVIKYTDKAYNEVQRIGRIAKSLLAFSRHSSSGRPSPFDVGPAVANVVTLVESQMHEAQVEVSLQPSEEIPPVMGLVNEFQQALLNLLLNARDAVKSGGDRRITVSVEQSEDAVSVRVTDTGPGVAADVRGRIFEPFFTTKSAGEGSGLGLSVATELMERMGGSVRLEPDYGPGAQFVLTLPTVDAAVRLAKIDSTPDAVSEVA